MPAIILPLFEAPLPLWLLAFWETRLPGPAGRKLFGKDAISGLSELRTLPALLPSRFPGRAAALVGDAPRGCFSLPFRFCLFDCGRLSGRWPRSRVSTAEPVRSPER